MDSLRSAPRRRGAVLVVGVMALLAGALLAGAAPSSPSVVQLTIEGVVDPLVANYVSGEIDQAQTDGAPAVLITIDTPGGLDSSMREIIQAIGASKVPVLCYTAPTGARAASAGTFIMMGCPVSAMAPGTNIGAAHPVGVSGAVEVDKVTNDAAAYIRSLADEWGRNAEWAEDAVRNSVSISAEDALKQHVIDLVEPSTRDLLNTAGGCDALPPTVTTGLLAQQGTLPGLCGVGVVERSMGAVAGVLHALIDPDLAFLFFFFGLALIIVELLHPGISVPGIVGTLMLIISFISFGLLPVQLVGLVLLVASAVCFLLELKHPGLGLPTLGGVVFLVLGALWLYSSSVPSAQVSPWLIVLVAAGLVVFFGFVVRGVMEARRMPRSAVPIHDLTGKTGTALDELAPRGRVRVERENWSAESTGRPIPAGSPIVVVDVKGLLLAVTMAGDQPAVIGGGAGQERGGTE
jgi:membrane-bound serine protease (ClpP class)